MLKKGLETSYEDSNRCKHSKPAVDIFKAGRGSNENIDQMLMERHLNKKARRASHKNHLKGPKKRTEEDDERFAQSFERIVKAALEEEK